MYHSGEGILIVGEVVSCVETGSGGAIKEFSVFSIQFRCEPKIALKTKYIYKKNHQKQIFFKNIKSSLLSITRYLALFFSSFCSVFCNTPLNN